MTLVSRMPELQLEQRREPQPEHCTASMASSSTDFSRKTRTVQQSQPEDPNSIMAEFTVKTRTVQMGWYRLICGRGLQMGLTFSVWTEFTLAIS